MNNDLSFTVGVDPTDFNGGLQNAAAEAQRFGGEITGKLSDKIFGLRDVSNVVATALGLNHPAFSVALTRVGFDGQPAPVDCLFLAAPRRLEVEKNFYAIEAVLAAAVEKGGAS